MQAEVEDGFFRSILMLAVLLALFANLAHCAIAKKPSANSLGVVQYYDNPLTYKEGAVTSAAYVDGGKGISIRIQPRGTFSLFTEDLLFCAGAEDKILGKRNPMVLVYKTTVHRTVEGIGCHDLVAVDEVKITKELP